MQTIEAVQFESLFDKRLQMYDVDQDMVKEEAREQQEAIKRLREANAAFVNARRGDQSTKQREQALQSLENAYYKYKEIVANLDVGRKFYNDLAKIVNRFRDDCRSFAYQRKQEASQIERFVPPQLLSESTDKRQRYCYCNELIDSAASELEFAPAAATGRRAELAIWSRGPRRGTSDGSNTDASKCRTTHRHVDARGGHPIWWCANGVGHGAACQWTASGRAVGPYQRAQIWIGDIGRGQ